MKSPRERTSLQQERCMRMERRINKEIIQDKMSHVNAVTEIQNENVEDKENFSGKTRTASTQTASDVDVMEQVVMLQKENENLKKLLLIERREKVKIENIFTKGQLHKLKSAKQIQWSMEDIASAVSLYAGGQRSYRLLRKRGYPLPPVSALRRWASKLNIEPGILNVVLTLIKNASLSKMEKSCVLFFDKMKIQYSYDYDKKNDTTLGPTKYVQVVIPLGICGNWKQPIFYEYDRKITKDVLFKLITKLENIGYPVYAINSDLDPLEGLFSTIRAIGGLYDHPTALQFKYRLRNYLLGRNDEIMSRSANVANVEDAPNIALACVSGISDLSGYNNDGDESKIVTEQMF
ncbi:unnamed protein product [Callosobruchus maculatus]|uniref:Transposable element P transposase-like RNase H domain-containing protein n=1 Tax=Callosobruchus maculatus TaxID=64391 RepID=A0A653CPV7_CALMS|nr:unnamed protein product [Callosobruchus maculatus]